MKFIVRLIAIVAVIALAVSCKKSSDSSSSGYYFKGNFDGKAKSFNTTVIASKSNLGVGIYNLTIVEQPLQKKVGLRFGHRRTILWPVLHMASKRLTIQRITVSHMFLRWAARHLHPSGIQRMTMEIKTRVLPAQLQKPLPPRSREHLAELFIWQPIRLL